MKTSNSLLLFVFLNFQMILFAQDASQPFRILRMNSNHTSFPDTGRAQGHNYDGTFYDAASHYSNHSVILVVPEKFSAGKHVDLIFWFHGWRNTIDSSLVHFHLANQLISSQRNAILVLAETATNAPDSYGGKLEQPNEFKSLIKDIMDELLKTRIVSANAQPDHIVLAGHSGAFRVIAHILQDGGVKIHEVYLMDALYGEKEKFEQWINADVHNRFIHWYTHKGGGTDEESLLMMDQLKTTNIHFLSAKDLELNPEILKANRIIFVESPRDHNEIITDPDNISLLMQTSPFLKKIGE